MIEASREVGTPSPYLLSDPPASSGRVLLSRGFEHYCVLQWGLSGAEIDAALRGAADPELVECVGSAARLLGGLMAAGTVKSWSRPFGGGESATIRASAWELDDFRRRFAASAIDPARPFDPAAPPTHWIFADLEDWNRVIEASVADVAAEMRTAAARRRPSPSQTSGEPIDLGRDGDESRFDDDRLIRLPEVRERTGLSTSTIYRKMRGGSFPDGIAASANVTVWREREVADWIANPS